MDRIIKETTEIEHRTNIISREDWFSPRRPWKPLFHTLTEWKKKIISKSENFL
jgi:hypothetical protein